MILQKAFRRITPFKILLLTFLWCFACFLICNAVFDREAGNFDVRLLLEFISFIVLNPESTSRSLMSSSADKDNADRWLANGRRTKRYTYFTSGKKWKQTSSRLGAMDENDNFHWGNYMEVSERNNPYLLIFVLERFSSFVSNIYISLN